MSPGTSLPLQSGKRRRFLWAVNRCRLPACRPLTAGPKRRPELCGDRVKCKTLGRDGVSLNRETVDLRYVEQIVDSEQTAALGACLLYAQKHLLDGRRTLREVVDELEE